MDNTNSIRRNHSIGVQITETSGNDDHMNLDIDEMIERLFDSSSKSETQRRQIRQHNILDSPETLMNVVRLSSRLVWGRSGQRSNTRVNVQTPIADRDNRLSNIFQHLSNSPENEAELNIFVKLFSLEEKRVPNLEEPYLRCKAKMSIDELCQYIASKTSLQNEEIELYIVNECEPKIIFGDAKPDPNNIKSEFLTRGEVTLVELTPHNLNRGCLVIAYKKKMWDLNVALC